MKIQVIHTLSKPYSRLYAGIYIQIPEQGVPDAIGRYYRSIHEEISVKDSPNDVIARCLDNVFKRSKEVNVITYVGPRRNKIEIQRGTSYAEIRERIREG